MEGMSEGIDTTGGDVGGDGQVEGGDSEQQQNGEQQPNQGNDGAVDGETVEEQSGGRANSAIRELRAQNQQLMGVLRALSAGRGGSGGGEGGEKKGYPPFTPSKEFEEAHGLLGGYVDGHFKHMAHPLAAAIMELREHTIPNIQDRIAFYSDNPDIRGEQRKLVEHFQTELSQKLGRQVERGDVLMMLRGHPQYGKHFVSAADRAAALDRDTVNARRGAGNVGGRPAAKVRGGQEPDLSKMSREERIKHLETVAADVPI